MNTVDKLRGFLPNNILNLFEQMEIAEQEIDKGKQKFPAQADRIHNLFKNLCPSDIIRYIDSDKLYRLYCRELIHRTVNDLSTNTATDAEVIGLLCMLSLNSPLKEYATGLYARLMKQHFDFDPDFGDNRTMDSYEELYANQMDELYQDAKRALSKGNMTNMRYLESTMNVNDQLTHEERIEQIKKSSKRDLMSELFK